MGSANSSLDDNTSGYHILKVQEGSPGHKAGLQAFFDFILSVGDVRLEEDNEMIRDVLTKHKDTPVSMQVYSSKTQTCRQVTLTPNADWGGQGLLGLSIRYCSFKGASENVWHILDVKPNSPASMAGLKPFTDYVIGTDALLNDSADFFSVVEAHNGQPLRFYVYNSDTDTCRDVTLIPNLSWGGDGMLGCEIGFGFLHRIPAKQEAEEKEEKNEPLEGGETKVWPPVANVSVEGPNNPPPPYSQALPSRQDFEVPQQPMTTSTLPGGYNPTYAAPLLEPTLIPPAPLPANLFDMIPSSTATTTISNNSMFPPPQQPIGSVPMPVPVQPPYQFQHPQTFFQPGPIDQSNVYAPGLPPIPMMPTTTNVALPGMPPISVALHPVIPPPPVASDLFYGQQPQQQARSSFPITESVN